MPLVKELVGGLALEFCNRAAVPGTGSSSSESGRGVGLISSRPVLEGREGRWAGCEGGMGDSCEEEEEIGLPSMRTSVSESPARSLRKGSLVRFSFSSISMRESRLCRSDCWGGVPGEGQGDGVRAGGVVGPTTGTGGGSGIGGVSGLSRAVAKSGVEGSGGRL